MRKSELKVKYVGYSGGKMYKVIKLSKDSSNMFQSHIGSIKRIARTPIARVRAMFQSHIGSIKSENTDALESARACGQVERFVSKPKLYHGDCLEVIKDIESGSVHSVITDIPYGISLSDWDVKHDNTNSSLLGSSPAQNGSAVFKKRGKPKNGWSASDKLIPLQFQEFCESFLGECERVLMPAGSIIAFTGRQYQHRYMVACENSNLVIKDTLAWNKTKAPFRAQAVGKVIGARGGSFDDTRRLGNLAPVFEPIVWAFKPYKIGGTLTDCYIEHGTGTFSSEYITKNIIEFDCSIESRKHEAEKPLGLMEVLINTFTKEGQTVLDCFMGSGTTGVACKNLNRNFIGIEKDKEIFMLAKELIKAC